MLLVLSKKTSEQAVFNENKGKYDEMINKLATLNKEIFDLKTNIRLKNEIYKKIMLISAKPNEENEKVYILN